MTPSAIGTVTATDETGYRVYVLLEGFAGGSSPTIPVEVLTHGPRDALRIKQTALPTPGTRGLILFARGDPRSGVWVGSLSGPLNTASTTRPGFGQVDYTSEWSGYWHLRDNGGNEITTWPDGSSLTVGTAPTPTRYVVDSSQRRVQAGVTQAQRVAVTPSPYPFSFTSAAGVTIKGDAFGNLTLQVPSTLKTISLGALPDVLAGSLSKVVIETFKALFNAHTHSGVQAGGASTGVPTTPMGTTHLSTVVRVD